MKRIPKRGQIRQRVPIDATMAHLSLRMDVAAIFTKRLAMHDIRIRELAEAAFALGISLELTTESVAPASKSKKPAVKKGPDAGGKREGE